MLGHAWHDETQAARIEAAFHSYAWRRMTVRAVALRLVEELVGEAVAADDGRLWAVERALTACHWRGLTVPGLVGQAVIALDSWHASCRWLEIQLSLLLDGGG